MDGLPGLTSVATISRKEERDMIFKPVGVRVALAAMFAISGCNQTTPSAISVRSQAVVQLSGFVASQTQIDKAVELAKGI
jgi:BON domain